MSHPYSYASLFKARKAVTFFLAFSLMFLSPVSVTLSVSWSDAQEAESGSSSSEGSGQSDGGTGGDAGSNDSGSEDGSGEVSGAAAQDEGGQAAENGPSEAGEGEDGGNGQEANQAPASTHTEGEESGPAENSTEGGAVSTGVTGEGGDGGATGEGGSGGEGGDAGAGGDTGGQDVGAETEASGGNGGNGGGPDLDDLVNPTTTPDVSTTTSATATTTGTTTSSTTPGTAGQTGATTTSAVEKVVTGDAIANASLLNLLNTNFVNSYGELLFLSNMFAKQVGKLDFRQISLFGNGGLVCSVCVSTSSRDRLEFRNDSFASTTNSISAHATSGENVIDSFGSGWLSTGDAYAAGNIINFINNNVIDSEYLFMTYNNFGDWDGDIVFPNAETFLSVLGGSNLPEGFSNSVVEMSNRGEASIENYLNLFASSGNNQFETLGAPGEIRTGNASTTLNQLDLTNANLFGGSSMNLFFKVHGSWSGKVLGLPPGVVMNEVPGGFTLSYETLADIVDGRPRDERVEVSNTADTFIKNSLDLSAVSGDNSVRANGGLIDTGDAYAAGNVINVTNSNIVGRNMFWAIVNIFGDWSGDVSFGKPDLWIGGHAEIPGATLAPGQEATYHLTVMNNGDMDAENAEIALDFGSEHLSKEGEGKVRIPVGTLKRGESKSVDVRAVLSPDMPRMSQLVTSRASVSAAGKDDNPADNEELISFTIERGGSRGRGSRNRTAVSPVGAASATTSAETALPGIVVTKTHSGVGIVRASTTVEYKITVWNDSDLPAHNAVLYDRLNDSKGASIRNEEWELGTLMPHEEVTVTYSVFFKGAMPSGIYTNSAYVSARASTSTDAAYTVSNVALSSIRIQGLSALATIPAGSVLTTASTFSTSTATTAEEAVEEEPAPLIETQQAHASDGGDSLLAAAFFSTPTGRQLTMFTLILLIIALGLMGLRKRYYS